MVNLEFDQCNEPFIICGAEDTGSSAEETRPFEPSGEPLPAPVAVRQSADEVVVDFSSPLKGCAIAKVFTSSGRFLTELENTDDGTLVWNLKDSRGNSVAAGIYLLQVSVEDKTWVRKVLIP